jgi:hypothetical protein
MKTQVFTRSACGVSVASAMVAGCGGWQAPTGAPGATPQNLAAATTAVHGIPAPAAVRRGIYVGLDTANTNTTVLGYAPNNRANNGPTCTEKVGATPGNIAVDDAGNLMVTTESSGTVLIYRGPGMCGPLLGTLETSAFSVDVASVDAVNGKVIVGNLQTINPSGFGNVEVCTLSGGCATSLTNPNIAGVFGVAVAHNGDCWASAGSFNSGAILVYFKGCSGLGQDATGFKNLSAAGLDIDRDGNLVAIDVDQFWVYRGCNPKCTLVGGPFGSVGYTMFGHLNRRSTQFVAGDYQYDQIDVYAYSPRRMTYEYSFNDGLSLNYGEFMGTAYDPRSEE